MENCRDFSNGLKNEKRIKEKKRKREKETKNFK